MSEKGERHMVDAPQHAAEGAPLPHQDDEHQSGADMLEGAAGADRLTGGKGNDTLAGGGGGDAFIFGLNSGTDRVLGFNRADGDPEPFLPIEWQRSAPGSDRATRPSLA